MLVTWGIKYSEKQNLSTLFFHLKKKTENSALCHLVGISLCHLENFASIQTEIKNKNDLPLSLSKVKLFDLLTKIMT